MVQFKQFSLSDYKDCLVVTDDKISSIYNIVGDNVYCLPQGEKAKCFSETEKLCEWFLSCNLSRNGTIVAVGGGSVGDTVGFAASIYKRGVKLIHVPTTVVAQIDSAIGGKTALNLGEVKNAVGTFYKADTIIDVNFWKTLDEEQILNGRGELQKYRMLSQQIESVPFERVSEIIDACVKYKLHLCDIDPTDKNERRVLNFGHTIGHALELAYNIPHGVAVANGLYYETLLAYKLGLCDKTYLEKWNTEIKKSFNIYALTDKILNLTLNDKKNDGDNIGFILPDDFKMVYLSLSQVKKLLC